MKFTRKNRAMKSRDYCSVFGCNARRFRRPELAFHKFPKRGLRNVKIRYQNGEEEWVDVRVAWELQLKMSKPTTSAMNVCSRHFTKDDYFYSASK